MGRLQNIIMGLHKDTIIDKQQQKRQQNLFMETFRGYFTNYSVFYSDVKKFPFGEINSVETLLGEISIAHYPLRQADLIFED